MTDEEKNRVRMQAIAAFNDLRRYERLTIESEDMEEHDLWASLRDRARLKVTLALSALEGEMA